MAVALGRPCQFQRGQTLLSEGEYSTYALLLFAGKVKVKALTADGREILLSIRVAGDVVGDLAAADGGPRTATVEACSRVEAREVPAIVWRAFLDRHPAANTTLHLVLGDRLRAATRRRVELGEYPASVRIARVLAEFVRQHGRDTRQGRELEFALTQSELAAAAECGVASVQSLLRQLRDEHIVETHYRRLVVLDLVALDRWARLV
ncbi:MAG: Crp/Fnr family transcriptional regulator [Frankia sp.]